MNQIFQKTVTVSRCPISKFRMKKVKGSPPPSLYKLLPKGLERLTDRFNWSLEPLTFSCSPGQGKKRLKSDKASRYLPNIQEKRGPFIHVKNFRNFILFWEKSLGPLNSYCWQGTPSDLLDLLFEIEKMSNVSKKRLFWAAQFKVSWEKPLVRKFMVVGKLWINMLTTLSSCHPCTRTHGLRVSHKYQCYHGYFCNSFLVSSALPGSLIIWFLFGF